MRFLFVVPPLTGHVNPTVSVAAELAARGHEVAWVGHPGAVRPLLPEGARLFALDDQIPESLVATLTARAASVRGLSGLKFLWEDFLLPLARAMVPGVEAAVDELAPDVLIVDQQAIAGALVARRRGLPFATFCTTSASVVDPLAGLPKVKEWLDDALRTLERDAGLPPVPEPDRSPSCVIVFSTLALVGGDGARFPPHYHFVGPASSGRPSDEPFPWETFIFLPPPRVLITLGTVNAERGERFFAAVCEAVAGQPMSALLVASPEQVPNPPSNMLVCRPVPQLQLLGFVDAVVCHAGHNTVCESLALGVPLVVAPIKDDQPVVAQQVVDAGAGVRVKFGRVTADELRAAMGRVLDETPFAEAAKRIAASFEAAGGAQAAATLLEGLR